METMPSCLFRWPAFAISSFSVVLSQSPDRHGLASLDVFPRLSMRTTSHTLAIWISSSSMDVFPTWMIFKKWLPLATGHPLPASFDSVLFAGLIDLLRTAGCWGLSLRYALLVASPTAATKLDVPYTSYRDYERPWARP